LVIRAAARIHMPEFPDRRLPASPDDILRRVLDIARPAMHAVLRVDDERRIALLALDPHPDDDDLFALRRRFQRPVFLSTSHEENQPARLTLKDATVPVDIILQVYTGPEARFRPPDVYEL
jgi:hypothetical protein